MPRILRPRNRGLFALFTTVLVFLAAVWSVSMLLSSERAGPTRYTTYGQSGHDNEWTRETAGRVTWSTLHLHAANMPFTEDHLSSEMAAERRANELLNTFERLFAIMGDLYVCSDCSNHFRSMISAHGLRSFVSDESNTRRLVGDATVYNPLERLRQLVSLYLCDLHNKVNERLQVCCCRHLSLVMIDFFCIY